tara:strand:+ start:506 stop:850 length:345 start_codon:yes stop_codon:yes gene_type:complete
MNKNRKLRKTDKKIQKKQIQQRKEKLSKLSTEQLMDKRRGTNPKSESKTDYIKRKKSEMSPLKLKKSPPFKMKLKSPIMFKGANSKNSKCWPGKKKVGTKPSPTRPGVTVNDCR